MSNIKLPKQWKHWVKKAGLKAHGYDKSNSLHYFIGRDRQWRVNDIGEFECSCPLEYFDRWANSRGASVTSIPTTEEEFINTVNKLIELSSHAR